MCSAIWSVVVMLWLLGKNGGVSTFAPDRSCAPLLLQGWCDVGELDDEHLHAHMRGLSTFGDCPLTLWMQKNSTALQVRAPLISVACRRDLPSPKQVRRRKTASAAPQT